MGGFGRLWDELGDGGEFEAGSCPGWLESDWKHWPSSLSESGQGVGLTYVQTAQRGVGSLQRSL